MHYSILVVDDDDVMRMQLKDLLQQAGYQVAEARDGDEALLVYVRIQPDMVLLDALMPRMDGYTCCTQLQALPNYSETPVLMITGRYDRDSVEQAFAAGATDYITKPVQWQVLLQRVRRLLEARRAMRELQWQTEQAQSQEAQLRMALEAARMSTWNWDILNNKLTWSDNIKTLLGLGTGTDETTYETFVECIYPQDRDFVQHSVKQALWKGTEYDIEFRVVGRDRSIRWIASKGVVFRDSSGVALRMSGVDMDITKRKQAEEAMEVYANRQALVAELSQEALAGMDLTVLMHQTVVFVAQSLEVEYCDVLELLQDGDTLLLRAGVGWNQRLVGCATVSASRDTQAGYTVYSQEPVIVNDQSRETRFRRSQLLHDNQVVSSLSVVIRGKDRPFGVLEVHTTKKRTFSKDAVYFLQAVTNVLATAIERQKVEDALRESEQRWQLALRGNNDGIWDWNLRTNEVFFSTRWKEMLGYSECEIDNHLEEWMNQIHPDDRNWVEQVIQDHCSKKTPFYISEYRIQCKDGSYKWILDRGQALWDKNDNATRMVGSHTDITERKLAEEKLRQSEVRSQLFADVTLKIRQSLQIDKVLQTSVTEVQKLLHADRVLIFRLHADGSGTVVQEAVVAGFLSVLGHNIDDPCFRDEYIQLYRQGRIGIVTDIERANVEPCYIEFLQKLSVKANLVVPILLKNKLWGLLIAHQCSHPREWTSWETELLRQLADQIGIAVAQAQMLEKETRQRQELARSNEELQQFAFIASHDLQEPLRKIKTFGERLQATCSEALTEQGRDYLDRMQNAVRRMQALIEDLLTLSRVTTRAQPFQKVNLNQVTEEVLSDLEVRILQTQGRVEVGELPIVDADPLQMRQLLQNLIGNALKFHRKGEPPVVRIYTQNLENSETGENCQLIVEDNGIGFDEKYLDRIFHVFQRLHGRNEYEGTGIGLAISRKIVERHGWSITALSNPGEGSKFIVSLPTRSVT
ncbi:MAG: PAS domain-containing protein [Scytonema sp. PMC 1069.18]|nr:PAS domain-containing protein [Scytonema sp. PMC 1069.18]MEC4885744.1 PAS domain-containing protein [Scytonema sp. PMC 1070.18]